MVNFVISEEKIGTKSGKKRDGVVMVLSHLHDLCTFPNMVINVNIARKSGEKEKKRIDMMQTVVDNIGVLFTWSVHISKNGDQHKYSQTIRKKQNEGIDMMQTVFDNVEVVFTWSVHISQYGEKEKKNRHLDTVVDNVAILFV